MRTTLTLEEDVAAQAKALSQELGTSFKSLINQALRSGLKTLQQKPQRKKYKTRAHKMGLRSGYDLDNIQELLAQLEGEARR